jgi:hypothetical protein
MTNISLSRGHTVLKRDIVRLSIQIRIALAHRLIRSNADRGPLCSIGGPTAVVPCSQQLHRFSDYPQARSLLAGLLVVPGVKLESPLDKKDLVQSLNLGPIWQASDSLSPRAPGSARRPFLKFAPEPFSKGIFLGSGSKSPSDRFAFVSSRKSKQYFFSSRALRYSSSVIDLRIVRGRRNIAIPPSKDSDVKIANRNVVKASFDSALVFSNVVFHLDHSVCKRANAQQPLP